MPRGYKNNIPTRTYGAAKIWHSRATAHGFESEFKMWSTWYPTKSPSLLALLFECTPDTIRNRIRRHGISMKPRGGPNNVKK